MTVEVGHFFYVFQIVKTKKKSEVVASASASSKEKWNTEARSDFTVSIARVALTAKSKPILDTDAVVWYSIYRNIVDECGLRTGSV